MNETYDEQLLQSIPLRYREASYEEVPEQIKGNFQEIKVSRKGLYIYGDVGTGKTHISYALHKNCFRENGIYSRFKNTVEFFKEIRDDISKHASDRLKPLDIADYKGVVIFDDVGVEKVTDFVLENFYLVVNKRYNDMLPTIFTSNFNLDELSDRLGDRIPSRIAEMCHIVKLEGKDRRVK